MIFAFDHEHKVGEICSQRTCDRSRSTLAGDMEIHTDVPMLILRPSTAEEYLKQPVPDGWVIPPLGYGCDHYYEIHTD